MEPFTRHKGIGVPLRRSNVDTDQIIPSAYLKRVTRTGFEDGLFSAWRNDPEFVLNVAPYDKGSVLVAGPDFGTGSSREHAVWALMDYGFKVVLSSRGDWAIGSQVPEKGAQIDDPAVSQQHAMLRCMRAASAACTISEAPTAQRSTEQISAASFSRTATCSSSARRSSSSSTRSPCRVRSLR